jgi:hypothetical protein
VQFTVRHVFDPRLGTGAIFEPDGVTDFLTETAARFLSDTFRHGHDCHTTRLGTAYTTSFCVAGSRDVLHHLCCVARASVTNDDQHLML